MKDTKLITAIENQNHLEAYDILEKTLYRKAGIILEEKKKMVSAKTWPTRNLTESNEKEIIKTSRRKLLKEKLKKSKEPKGEK